MTKILTSKQIELNAVGAELFGEHTGFGEDALHRRGVQLRSGLKLKWSGHNLRPVKPSVSRSIQLIGKRAFDIVVALLALIVLAPLLLLVAAAVKATSKGPVFFRQHRDGLNGQKFAMYKFRTMWWEAGDHSGINQTTKGDPRITPLGRFLRRTSIDELPQLLNVLKGDMSIVGPRPHVSGMLAAGVRYDILVREYHYRLQMRPGITGWAQANGFRGETVEPSLAIGRIEHDFAYIQNFSLALDLWIVLKTIRNEFLTGSGH